MPYVSFITFRVLVTKAMIVGCPYSSSISIEDVGKDLLIFCGKSSAGMAIDLKVWVLAAKPEASDIKIWIDSGVFRRKITIP